MNSREKYAGNKEDFFFFLKDEVIKLFKDNLKIEGNSVLIPDNEELDYQIKFDSDENYGDFVIKVKWGEKPEEINLEETEEENPLEF
jgi:hypothetical protein